MGSPHTIQPSNSAETASQLAVAAELPTNSPAESPQLPDEKLAWLDSFVPSLKSFLDQEPKQRESVERILDQYLIGPPNVDTLNRLVSATKLVMGDSAAECLLTGLARGFDDPEFFEKFVNRLDDETRAWVRLLMALYGNRLRENWMIGGEQPEDWRGINQEINYGLYSDRWLIKLDILKYSGDKAHLEMQPGSLANLVATLLSTLQELPPGAAVSSIDINTLTDIRTRCDALLTVVSDRLWRQQLVEIMMKAPDVEQVKTRARWLTGIPAADLTRHAGNALDDVTEIVDQLAVMDPLDSGSLAGERPLLILLDNVLSSMKSPDLAKELQIMRDDLEQRYRTESEA